MVLLKLFFIGITISRLGYVGSNICKADFCALKCSNDMPEGQHTMCKYKGPSPTCGEFSISALEFEMFERLDWHNRLRNNISSGAHPNQTIPTATNMKLMVWDQDLATVAHRWLTQCTTKPDNCRDSLDGELVGQNIGNTEGNFYTPSADYIMDEWLQELDEVTNDTVKSYYDSKTSRIGQILWHSTDRVGCSEIIFKNGTNQAHRVFACNYAPKGVEHGKPMFQTGAACTACPEGTLCNADERYPYLCGSARDMAEQTNFTLEDCSGQIGASLELISLMVVSLL